MNSNLINILFAFGIIIVTFIIMNVTYLKPHNGKSPGDTEEVNEDLGKYLVLMKVIEEAKGKSKGHKEDVEAEDKPKRGRKPKEY